MCRFYPGYTMASLRACTVADFEALLKVMDEAAKAQRTRKGR